MIVPNLFMFFTYITYILCLSKYHLDYFILLEFCSKLHQRSAQRLRDVCSKNGGVFIKVGQHISSLEYLLPHEYTQTMKIFHNQAPQTSLEDLYRVIEDDLGKKVIQISVFKIHLLRVHWRKLDLALSFIVLHFLCI